MGHYRYRNARFDLFVTVVIVEDLSHAARGQTKIGWGVPPRPRHSAPVNDMDIGPKSCVDVRLCLALDNGGEAYVATCRAGGASDPLASIVLPREIVEAAVLMNASLGLELRTDGSVVAFASHTSMQTLARASLAELVNETLRPEFLALEEKPSSLIELEAELKRALASVREFRSRRSIRKD